MRREQFPLVSRTRCSALRAAPQSRDLSRRCEMDPGSAAHRCALRCVRGTPWPRRRFQTCLMKECGESNFRSCPGRGAAPFALLRRAGTYLDAARWTPAQQRTAARCAASAERCGPAGGLSDVSDEGMRREQFPLVSRTRRSALRAAPQSRDLSRRCEMDPGYAGHTCALRCVRGTTSAAALQFSKQQVARTSAAICGYKGNMKIPDVARLIRASAPYFCDHPWHL